MEVEIVKNTHNMISQFQKAGSEFNANFVWIVLFHFEAIVLKYLPPNESVHSVMHKFI